jgi:hypothetical protein
LTLTAGTFDLGAFTVNRSAAGGTLTVSNGTLLKVGGTNPLPTNYSAHSVGGTSTIEYSGTNQAVSTLNSGQIYGNLIISGSGTKTLQGATTVAANLTINGGMGGFLNMTNVKVINPTKNDLTGSNLSGIVIKNCDFIGRGIYMQNIQQMFISGCNFYATNGTDSLLNLWSCTDVSVTNCTAQDFDVNSSSPEDHGMGRFFTGSAAWGSANASPYQRCASAGASFAIARSPARRGRVVPADRSVEVAGARTSSRRMDDRSGGRLRAPL